MKITTITITIIIIIIPFFLNDIIDIRLLLIIILAQSCSFSAHFYISEVDVSIVFQIT